MLIRDKFSIWLPNDWPPSPLRTNKDRLPRFGFDLVAHRAQAQNAEIVVLNTESLSPEQEMVQDLMTITHCFSARLYGLRNYRKALKKAISDDQGA